MTPVEAGILGVVLTLWCGGCLLYSLKTGEILGHLLRMEKKGNWRYTYLQCVYSLGFLAGIGMLIGAFVMDPPKPDPMKKFIEDMQNNVQEEIRKHK